MSTGTYSRLSLVSSANTVLVPTLAAANTAVITVNMVNTSANAASIRLAITSNTTNTQVGGTVNPAANNSEYIEYNTVIGPSGVLERTGLVLQSGLQIVAFSNTAGVTAVSYGMETIG